MAAACTSAVLLGWQLADAKIFSFDLAGLVASGAVVIALGAILVKAFGQPADVVLLGLVVAGYIVGNRGFAQLMPSPNLPLLPAEGTLLIAGGWCLIGSAFERRLPWRRDALNVLVLLWLVAGTARLVFDIGTYGFLAVRDYAMVYYALFFFIAQRMAREPSARRYLHGCLLVSLLILPVVYVLYVLFPEVFLTQLTVRNAPVIYYKGDLANTFLGAGSLLVFFAVRGRHRWWGWPLSAGLFVFVATGGNRASMLGLLFAAALLLVARRWAFPAWQAGATTLVGLVVFGLAVIGNNTWAEKEIASVTDRLDSIVDVRGSHVYQSDDNLDKSDNNRFRLIWWRDVLVETWHADPVFGLGFGADLAHDFVQEYYPEANEEFNARSPHNIFLTTYGRMGAVGLAVFSALAVMIVLRAWRALRRTEDPRAWAGWCILCFILVSASLGVVLEGPMGAVPFWVILGLLNGATEPVSAGNPVAAAPSGQEDSDAREGSRTADVAAGMPA